MSQTTKKALEDSLKHLLLQKPLPKITIQDITDDCGISRMTFYYHFKDIYDLIEWVCIENASQALGENKDIHIKIDGYTDFIGTEAYNLELSVKRANAIKDFLISRGAIGSNISIEGYGEQNPADTNQTAAGRSRNRRVEFIISRG